eukprot:jgi/Bigna1/144614/aug1.89_g19322
MNRPPRRCNSRFASFLVACTAAVLLHGTLGKTGSNQKSHNQSSSQLPMASTRKRGSAVGTYYDLKLCVKDTPETWAVVIDDNNATRRAKIANRTRVMVPERYIRRSDSEVARRILPSPYEVEVTTYAGVGKASEKEMKDGNNADKTDVNWFIRHTIVNTVFWESTIRELIGADEICEDSILNQYFAIVEGIYSYL